MRPASGPSAQRHRLVMSTLQQYQSRTRDMLLSMIPECEPREYLWDLVPSYPMRGGKGFRPGLCIATCRAFGGEVEHVLRSAVALELFHNAFLVHDDVEDGSELRRGLPTLHGEHGVPIAINVGDAMNVLSIRPLMLNLQLLGPWMTWAVFSEIEHMVRQSVEGQAMELGWVRDNRCDLTEADYLRMNLKKTCWYTCIHPCRIGALVGSGGEADLDAFNRFGYYMGAAFQIQDDLLNLVGQRERYGKEIGGDILEGKRTLMLIHLMETAADEREWLREFLGRPRLDRENSEVRRILALMHERGSIEHARTAARQLAGAALHEFENAYGDLPDGDDKRFLREIVFYMIERDL
jgi:geranylgeranyl diphosphate synthase type II